jgi:hypothetical protein
MPNGGDGVRVADSAGGNTIGSQAVRAGNIVPTVANIIAFNLGNGVAVTSGVGNALQRNSIFSNAKLGIDLSTDGPTPNDSGDADTGPNNLQNSPAITSLEISAQGDLVVIFDVSSGSANSSYPITVEFYVADSANGGQGKRYLGAVTDIQPDLSQGPQSASIGRVAEMNISAGDSIVATATDSEGNTSEFSTPIIVSTTR